MLKVAFLCGKTSFKISKHSPFSTFIYRILQFVSNENKCLLILRLKVYAIFDNASRLSRATLCCIVWAPVPQPPTPLPHWLTGWQMGTTAKCTYVRSRSREKTEKRRRRRQKRGHSTATKRLACHPVLGQSAARQVLSKQLSSSSGSGSRCHKCCKLAMPLQTLHPSPSPHSPLPWPFRQLPQSV